MERLFFGRGYSFDRTLAIQAKQLSEAGYRALADAEVDNGGDLRRTKASLAKAMQELKARKEARA